MSQYLRFIVDRANAPHPGRITILRHSLPWVNRQLQDELACVFPSAEITLLESVPSSGFDLLVLPYMKDFVSEQPGGIDLYRRLSAARGGWVMRYELDYRNVDVFPAANLWSFYRSGVRLRMIGRLLCRLQLPRLFQAASRLIRRA